MKTKSILMLLGSLVLPFALAGCDYRNEAAERYKVLYASFNRLAHRKVGTSELLTTTQSDRYDLVIKRHEYINYQATAPGSIRGQEYCEEFSVIRAIDVPGGALIIPYSKVDTIDGVSMALSNAIILPDLTPETMVAIPNELPGTTGLAKPYKIESQNRVECFFRPEGVVPN